MIAKEPILLTNTWLKNVNPAEIRFIDSLTTIYNQYYYTKMSKRLQDIYIAFLKNNLTVDEFLDKHKMPIEPYEYYCCESARLVNTYRVNK